MSKKEINALIVVIVLALAFGAYYLLNKKVSPKPIGGDRDSNGCLVGGGYAFDPEVGACDRSFELTPDIKRAAKMAVDYAGPGYALTVVSFNSYEEPGAYDIVLERGIERTQQIVYIKNWQIVNKN